MNAGWCRILEPATSGDHSWRWRCKYEWQHGSGPGWELRPLEDRWTQSSWIQKGRSWRDKYPDLTFLLSYKYYASGWTQLETRCHGCLLMLCPASQDTGQRRQRLQRAQRGAGKNTGRYTFLCMLWKYTIQLQIKNLVNRNWSAIIWTTDLFAQMTFWFYIFH